MPETRLIDFLDKEHVKYVKIGHSPAYTAQEIAALAHIPGKELAKTVIVKVDDELAMVVLPASEMVRLDHLRESLGTEFVELAEEDEFKSAFPDCETGAMPPFGSQYEMQTIVDQSLVNDDVIVFEGNTHHESIRMRFCDFVAIEHPQLGRIAH